jgi:hypothetical protein
VIKITVSLSKKFLYSSPAQNFIQMQPVGYSCYVHCLQHAHKTGLLMAILTHMSIFRNIMFLFAAQRKKKAAVLHTVKSLFSICHTEFQCELHTKCQCLWSSTVILLLQWYNTQVMLVFACI